VFDRWSGIRFGAKPQEEGFAGTRDVDCMSIVVDDGAQLHYDSQVKELAAMGVQSIKVVSAGGCLVYAFGDVNLKSGGNLVATVGGKSQLLCWGTRTPT
jgi:hypothetical protein